MENSALSLELVIMTETWSIHGEAERRDRDAAQQVSKQARAVLSHAPEQVTTDGDRSSPRAVRETPGYEVVHRTSVSLNNQREQNHRGSKQQSYSLHGFKNFASAARFCRAFDECRQYFRSRSREKETRSLAQHRLVLCEQLAALQALMVPISSFSTW
jgi:transposase-like protein